MREFLVGNSADWYSYHMISPSHLGSIRAFTLHELMVALAIVSVLLVGAGVFVPYYLNKAKTAEAVMALAEVRRLESDFFTRTGTYSSDLNQIGFHPTPSLKYYTVFIQVEKGPKGWSYMILIMPNGETTANGGWYVSQGPDGKIVSSLPGQAGSGTTSGCSAWNGWGSMEGGTIEGEEQIASSRNGTPPCGGGGPRVVQHGNASGPAVSAGSGSSQAPR